MTPRIKISDCPTCGSRKIKWKVGIYRWKAVKNFAKCRNWAGMSARIAARFLFDTEAIGRLQVQWIPKSRRKHVMSWRA